METFATIVYYIFMITVFSIALFHAVLWLAICVLYAAKAIHWLYRVVSTSRA